MIKLVYCITKKTGLSDAEFTRYWRDVHGPIGARLPGLRRLVQSHVAPGSAAIRPPDYDGLAELWFDDLESLDAARRTLEWRLSTEDEARFIDPSRVAILITEEHEVEIPRSVPPDRLRPRRST